ncbi:hypothetical protein VHA01S_019_00280 [Vibrio halioticoli NBRC 102217]|uniref:CobQ/CobB/MinD/ParA nucleotide binding domain-containing protein n=1 Tax=Vibrio halioticoli NBRC 102217 TaxID=1219072 RepID=V5FHN4_9VIBR|nr:hypothetical protein [Vibrio halioticoli]GAD89351.1 hypothetical protein VHA01S_019_00280 [Vibrio halioticoli NBRC 102217]
MIHCTHSELTPMFLQLELANMRSVCLIGNKPRAGVTTFACALAEQYMLSGYRTLLVDLNLENPQFEHTLPIKNSVIEEADLQSPGIENAGLESASLPRSEVHWVQNRHTLQIFSGVAVPSTLNQQMPYRDPRSLAKQFELWFSQYDRIVIDAGAINQNQTRISQSVIANACDTTFIALGAGNSNKEQLSQAIDYLTTANANIFAVLLNQYAQQTLSQQLCHLIGRNRIMPKKMKERFNRYVRRWSFLNHAV